MWLASVEATKLRQLMVWRSKKSGAKVVLDLISEAWYEEVNEAEEHGHTDAQFEKAALYARKYYSGEGTIRHINQAHKWLLKSAEQGYRESAAYNNLGMLSLLCDKEKRAAEWFQASAEKGNTVALCNRGLLGLARKGVQESYPQVAEWFQASAEQGFSDAQQILGVLYALGKGVPQNYEKALEWLCRARKDEAMACENFLARVLSTFPHDEYGLRNGQVAVSIAERLVRSNASREHLETLAAAYAEAHRFEDAIRIQKKVRLKLQRGRPSMKRGVILKDCECRLTSYTAKKPWRDESLRLLFCWD
jgi:TPR repeat protein